MSNPIDRFADALEAEAKAEAAAKREAAKAIVWEPIELIVRDRESTLR